MRVELQSELRLHSFWRDVRRTFLRLAELPLMEDWTFILRPKTPLDDGLHKALTGAQCDLVDELVRFYPYHQEHASHWSMVLSASSRTCEFVFPKGSQRWVALYSDGKLITAELLACHLLDALEMAIED